jgi:hypothetical protein
VSEEATLGPNDLKGVIGTLIEYLLNSILSVSGSPEVLRRATMIDSTAREEEGKTENGKDEL